MSTVLDNLSGFRGIERFLLPTERRVITVRRHWAILLEPMLSVLGGLIVLFVLDAVLAPEVPLMRDLLLIGWVILALRLVWRLLEWQQEWFVVTDRRLLLRSGILTRKIGMMPLIKVTDMSYERPLVGRALGYGEIIIESAGQDQALHRVRYLPHPDGLYSEICELLFGPQSPTPGIGGMYRE